MTILRLALAQFDFPVGAISANAQRARELMTQARDIYHADLIAFPELTLCGYPPEDLLLRPAVLSACTNALNDVASAATGIAAFVGHPHSVGEVYNAASLLCDGKIAEVVHKQALPNYAVFDEKRYFRPGHRSGVVEIRGIRVGLLICEDIWESEPAAQSVAKGAELLLVINASPFDIDKAQQREKLLIQRAQENKVAIAYLNLVGGQDDLLFDGASLLVDADGSISARTATFTDALLIADYDSATRRFTAHSWPQDGDTSRTAHMYAALVRGTRDYIEKNHFPGVLLGLSGGIDSALTLAIAVDAIGAERVTAVMLPTRYTSQLSLDQAAMQTHTLGVNYQVLSIEPGFQAFLQSLAPLFAQGSLDVTEENLQARCRGIMLMALSNKFGSMLLSTSNKSEMAVGYATLYGDMCGGYAPLKDVYKTDVFALARWRNAMREQKIPQGDSVTVAGNRDITGEVIPEKVIARPPSAELRDNQTDQDSLPPYDVLDAILLRFIEGEQSPEEIVAAGYEETTVRQIARLVLLNEHKRRQSALGPRISRRAFDRDRRYPISSGWH